MNRIIITIFSNIMVSVYDTCSGMDSLNAVRHMGTWDLSQHQIHMSHRVREKNYNHSIVKANSKINSYIFSIEFWINVNECENQKFSLWFSFIETLNTFKKTRTTIDESVCLHCHCCILFHVARVCFTKINRTVDTLLAIVIRLWLFDLKYVQR